MPQRALNEKRHMGLRALEQWAEDDHELACIRDKARESAAELRKMVDDLLDYQRRLEARDNDVKIARIARGEAA